MHSQRYLVFLILLLSPPSLSLLTAQSPAKSVTGHARVNIELKGDKLFTAQCTANFVLTSAACDEKACQAASTKAAEKLAAFLPNGDNLRIEPLSQCECSSGSKVNWAASCDKLTGLARQLCYAGPK
jgi:hypothetical protein